MFNQGDRSDSPNIAIILTDGKSDDPIDTQNEALEARKAGIHIVAIGVGESINLPELKGIATDPDDESVFVVKDFNALTGTVEKMLKNLCNGQSLLQTFNIFLLALPPNCRLLRQTHFSSSQFCHGPGLLLSR